MMSARSVAGWLVAIVASGGLGLGLASAGCRGSSDDAPPCSAVAARFLDIARHELDGAKLDDATRHDVTDQLPAMRDTLAQACTDGHWTAATRKCLVQASDHVSFEACEQQLTDEQRRDLDRANRGTTP
jgi:hypothetical protein